MPRLSPKIPALFLTASLASVATLSMPAAAQQATPRQAMEQCVATVLKRLARSRAAESQVGSAVVTQCDRQLRATLAAAIRSGEAGTCTVDTCIDLARARAAEQALQIYRQHVVR